MTIRYQADANAESSVVGLALHLIEKEYGPILGSPALWRLLGYRTVDAFRKAVQRGTVPVPTFSLPHRRGQFARTADVVRWLASVVDQPKAGQGKEAPPET